MKLKILAPVAIGLLLLEIFIGGARLLYAIPGVAFVAIAAILSIWPDIKTSRRADLPAMVGACAFALYILIRNRLSDIELPVDLPSLLSCHDKTGRSSETFCLPCISCAASADTRLDSIFPRK